MSKIIRQQLWESLEKTIHDASLEEKDKANKIDAIASKLLIEEDKLCIIPKCCPRPIIAKEDCPKPIMPPTY